MAICTSHPEVVRLAKRAFPDYNGKKFKIDVATYPINCASYWSGGSRSFYTFLRLDGSDAKIEIPQQSMFDKKIEGADKVELVPGLVCVKHSIFCGKDMGITIFYHPANAPKQITEKVELTYNQKVVLYYTRYYKNTYGGRTNIRFHEANREKGITPVDWSFTQAELVGKGLLAKNLSITDEGRNAITDIKGTYDIPIVIEKEKTVGDTIAKNFQQELNNNG